MKVKTFLLPFLMVYVMVLISTPLIPIVNAQIWSWGYSIEFDKEEYTLGSQGIVTLSFDVFPNAEVCNITINLYFIKSNGEIILTTLEYSGSTGVFDFYLEKNFDFAVPADQGIVSGPINYVTEFAIRGPYDPRYSYETTSLEQGLYEGRTVQIYNPSLPLYTDLITDYNALNSSFTNLQNYNSLLEDEVNDLNNSKNFFMITTAVFIIMTIVFTGTTIYFAVRKSKVKPELKANPN